MRRELYFIWETPEYRDDEGHVHTYFNSFSFTMHPMGSLRKFVQDYLATGRRMSDAEADDLDLESALLGRTCTIKVEETTTAKGKLFYKVMSAELEIFTPELSKFYPVFMYSVDSDDQSNYKLLPEWLQKKVLASREMQTPKTLPIDN